MSVSASLAETTSGPWNPSLWRRQLLAMLRLELRKAFLGRRSLFVYLLAAAPVLMLLVVAVIPGREGQSVLGNLGQARTAYAMVYQTFILRAVIFFGCLGIFTNLFRGEILDRSLHYYLLTPLRREVLVVGKYLSGLVTTVSLFVTTTVLSFLTLYLPFGLARAAEDIFGGPGLGQLLSYVSVTALACLGYGSVFLIVGLLFRNPIVPAAVVLGWETINFLLPPMLKRLSVVHYLKGFYPVPMSEGPFAVVSDPPSVWVSVLGLLALTTIVLVLASLLMRRFQIRYSDD